MKSVGSVLVVTHFLLGIMGADAGSAKKNVLFIMADDMRPNIAAYGHSFMKTPNLDKLASEATLFQRAYVQYSFCAPSRNSFMTGRRVDATQVWSFLHHFREEGVGDKWTSMPEYFRKQGYTVYGAGKMYHPGLPPNFDMPRSWDRYVWGHYGTFGCNGTVNGWPILAPGITNVTCPKATCRTCKNTSGAVVDDDSSGDWCSYDTEKLPYPLEDSVTANYTISHLREVARDYKETGKNFFVAAGFHKPHVPYFFPKRFLDMYPENVSLPKYNMPPEGMPLCAWHEGGAPGSRWGHPAADDQVMRFRRAYYAAVSFTDYNVGLVLDELERLGLAESTVVAFMGDHGYQLGEMNIWHKMTNFELGTRVPLIIRVPWKAASVGVKSPAIVEAVDLYQTFVGLTGVDPVPESEGLQGYDLSPLFDDPAGFAAQETRYAFSQFAKRYEKSSAFQDKVAWDTCSLCDRNSTDVFGYTVRSENYRYTEWCVWNKTSLRPNWDQVIGRELYNHTGDFGTNFNFATPQVNIWNASSATMELSDSLRKILRNQFQNDHQPPDAGNTSPELM